MHYSACEAEKHRNNSKGGKKSLMVIVKLLYDTAEPDFIYKDLDFSIANTIYPKILWYCKILKSYKIM